MSMVTGIDEFACGRRWCLGFMMMYGVDKDYWVRQKFLGWMKVDGLTKVSGFDEGVWG